MATTPTFSRRILLGIRFWDPIEQQPVDGLKVAARAYSFPRPRVEGVRTPSGYYGFHSLPGMSLIEQGLATGPVRSFLIEVEDPQGRFTSVSFPLEVPLESGPIFPPTGGEGNPQGFLLFSSILRRPGVGVAVVRASLIDQATEAPAKNAVLQVKLPDDSLWYGISDDRGEVAVLMPYPPFEVALDEENDPILLPLTGQSWSLEVSVLYNSSTLVFAPQSERPELPSIFLQPPGSLWENAEDPSGVPTLTTTLRFQEALVIRTGELPVLWVGAGPAP